jgi:hypothetical protein
MRPVNKNPSEQELRSFGWVMVGGFALIGALLWYTSVKPLGAWLPVAWGWTGAPRQIAAAVLWTIGPIVWAVAMASASATRPIYLVWMTVAGYMGVVSSFIVLSLLFFVALPPFSLIRLLDPLRKKLNGSGQSYWEKPVVHEATLERMAKPF